MTTVDTTFTEADIQRALKIYFQKMIKGTPVSVRRAAREAGLSHLANPHIHSYMASQPGIGMPDTPKEAEQYLQVLETSYS